MTADMRREGTCREAGAGEVTASMAAATSPEKGLMVEALRAGAGELAVSPPAASVLVVEVRLLECAEEEVLRSGGAPLLLGLGDRLF